MSKSTIFKQTSSVFIITLMIKLFGFIKQAVLAYVYGATLETDVFYMSSSIINSLCLVVFSAITISLLSMYTKKMVVNNLENANMLINDALKAFLPFAFLLTILFYVFSPYIAKFLAPTYYADELVLLVRNIKILSILFVLWCYFLTINVVAEAHKHFIPGKGYNFLQNVFIILVAICMPTSLGLHYLVYSFVVAGIVQCIFITICVRRQFKLKVFHKISNQSDIYHLLYLVLPLLVGNAIYEINDIVDKRIASSLNQGSVSLLTYGASVNEIVTTVIITSVSTVLFAHFATWVAEKKYDVILTNLKTATESLAAITLPIMCICLLSGKNIVDILFGRGNFGQYEVIATYSIVCGYAIGFIAQAMRANLVNIYYAFGDTKTPMINGALAVTFNIVCSITLSKILGVFGISLATSLAMMLATYLLSKNIKKHLPSFQFRRIIPEVCKVLISCGISAIFVFLLKDIVLLNSFFSLVFESIIFLIIYFIMMIIVKSNSILMIKKLVK